MEQGCQVADVACGSDAAGAGAAMIDVSCGPDNTAVVDVVDGGGVEDVLHHLDDSLLLQDQFDRYVVHSSFTSMSQAYHITCVQLVMNFGQSTFC